MEKVWIVKEGAQVRAVVNAPQFFGIEIELDPELVKGIAEFQTKVKVFQTWLQKIEVALATRNPDIEIEEAPTWLKEAGSEPQPEKRDTEAPSSKASPKPRKKKASSSTTSRKTGS